MSVRKYALDGKSALVEEWSEDGTVVDVGRTVEGLKSGPWRTLKNDVLVAEVEYVAGKDVKLTLFHPNGARRRVAELGQAHDAQIYDGSVRDWGEAGTLVCDRMFADGKEVSRSGSCPFIVKKPKAILHWVGGRPFSVILQDVHFDTRSRSGSSVAG